MIRFLSIENLAVVDRVELDLQPGLTVLTGETGAGKSIVVGALNLLVGGRAASDLVRTGEDRARVQATVEDPDGRERILRREVTAQGRSRAFIDDTLATVGALQEQGRRLVDLHGQHDHQALLDPTNHLDLLDRYAACDAELRAVASAYCDWSTVRDRLDRLRETNRDRSERIDLLTFQRDEIDRLSPTAGEDTELNARRTRLANADRLASLCDDAYGTLYERDDAIVSTLGNVWRQLDELATLDARFVPYANGRPSIESTLEDLAFFLRSYRAQIEASPDELAHVESRLADLERLTRKYGPTLDDVLEHRTRIDAELSTYAVSDDDLASLRTEEERARLLFEQHASTLGQARRAAASRLDDEMRRLLARLAIPHARFETIFASESLPESRWSERGQDAAEFFFSANPGEAVRPLARVASGGELSRVMLALKTLACTDAEGKTLVFDEVDAGIGGAVADSVGSMLSQLAERYQIICVTHLPQIAAYAHSHHHVSKVVQDGRTVTRVELLAEEGRVTELARLMTGGASAAARAGAEEMLGKQKTKVKGESERRRAHTGG